MTDLELFLIGYVVFLNLMFCALLALQRSLNKTVADVLNILTEGK